MVTPESIQHNIAQGIATEHLSVVGDDGTHFEAVIVSEAFSWVGRCANWGNAPQAGPLSRSASRIADGLPSRERRKIEVYFIARFLCDLWSRR